VTPSQRARDSPGAVLFLESATPSLAILRRPQQGEDDQKNCSVDGEDEAGEVIDHVRGCEEWIENIGNWMGRTLNRDAEGTCHKHAAEQSDCSNRAVDDPSTIRCRGALTR
jgi:hypothetical protein